MDKNHAGIALYHFLNWWERHIDNKIDRDLERYPQNVLKPEILADGTKRWTFGGNDAV